jgi:arsenate reductase
MSNQRPRVLFLCTANSARSQMAEALLRHHAPHRFDASSAGLHPADIHPMTLRVLSEVGVDTRGLSSKGVDQFLGKRTVNYAIVVCEKAQQSCPRIFPFTINNLYWPFDDPAAFEGSDREKLQKFRDVRDQINDRIRHWLGEQGATEGARQ